MRLSNSQFQIAVLLACLLATAGNAAAGTLTGVVRNGTTGRAVPRQDVVIIDLQGNMDALAVATTDAQGRYSFDNPAIGQAPILVRVNYRGVNFHQNVPPGRSTADIEVFEPTTDARAFEVVSRVLILQPNGPSLIVGEEYTIQNNSRPPAAYFKADGSFEFELPDGAEVGQVNAWGPSGMPVTQGTIDKAKNRYAIAYPFRPGQNGLRLAYQLPYPNNQATLPAASSYPAQRVSLIVPPTVQVQAEGFTFAGQDQGWNVYTRDAVPARASLNLAVSGTAPAPNLGETQTGEGSSTSEVSQLPGRLENLKWPLIAGFGSLFMLGVIFLWRKSRLAGARVQAVPASTDVTPTDVVANVRRAVDENLDQIKDTLFRLELRRQAGTISDEEYARERARAEETLRHFLQG